MAPKAFILPENVEAGPHVPNQASLTVAALNPFARQWNGLSRDLRASLIERTTALLAHANLSTLDLIDPEARIPLRTASELLALAEAVTGPGLGLRAAEGLMVGDLGVFEYVARTCATLGGAIETACRYRSLMYDGAELTLVLESDCAKLRYRLSDQVANPITFVEFALTACVVASRHALGFEGAPREVRFSHAEPAYAAEYARIFRAPVHFRATVRSIFHCRVRMPRCMRSSSATRTVCSTCCPQRYQSRARSSSWCVSAWTQATRTLTTLRAPCT
jgi:hypothetical protein